MSQVKSDKEIAIMVEGGSRLGVILSDLLDMAHEGVNLLDIEAAAQASIAEAGGTPSFQTVEGYNWATCLCVNDVVVHGIPSSYTLAGGDILTIDVGMLYEGLHTDTAWTKWIEPHDNDSATQTFLETGEKAFWEAVACARAGNHVGDVSAAIDANVTGGGYSVIASLVGHGVGKTLHEDPQIPGIRPKNIQKTPVLTEGMTIAVEVIYAQGDAAIINKNNDGWTLSTKDESKTAVYEHTLVITSGEPRILTRQNS